jgi:ribosomal-protein-alanine N-acetyltransferase
VVNPEVVELVPPTPADAAAWAVWRSEPQALRYMPLAPVTVESLAGRLAQTSADLGDRAASEYRWMVRADGVVVGTVAALRPSWAMGYVEIAYHLGERDHRRGIGTRALAALLDLLYAQPELNHVWATVSHDNVPSRRLLERLGFVHEGTLREHFVIGGVHVDQCVYGLLRREWGSRGR